MCESGFIYTVRSFFHHAFNLVLVCQRQRGPGVRLVELFDLCPYSDE